MSMAEAHAHTPVSEAALLLRGINTKSMMWMWPLAAVSFVPSMVITAASSFVKLATSSFKPDTVVFSSASVVNVSFSPLWD